MFASKPREEKTAFMEGLDSVLDRFSEGLWARKILPSLPEEVGRSPILEHRQGLILLQMKDPHLLPSTLSNVFSISTGLSPSQSLCKCSVVERALFRQGTIAEYDDTLELLQGKCDKPVFQEHVLPLVYNALDSEHAVVSTRTLEDFA